MKSDVNKLYLECKWQNLTEGMQIYGDRTSLDFNPASGLLLSRKLTSQNVSIALCTFLFAPTVVFP
ncbi:MAG: hypothetical protein LUG95_04775 [Clostridiales bacterium]|nr:hypothetical protein [Clostridiales bacterium]